MAKTDFGHDEIMLPVSFENVVLDQLMVESIQYFRNVDTKNKILRPTIRIHVSSYKHTIVFNEYEKIRNLLNNPLTIQIGGDRFNDCVIDQLAPIHKGNSDETATNIDFSIKLPEQPLSDEMF